MCSEVIDGIMCQMIVLTFSPLLFFGRSTSNIVEAAQKIISSSKDASSGADDLRQKMIPKREAGKPPVIVGCDDAKEEGM